MQTLATQPFGLELHTSGTLGGLDADEVHRLLLEHRVLVYKGLEDPGDQEMVDFCGRLGEILEWSFGAINELKADPQAKNYIYTNAAVPFHWDGAFAGKIPFAVFFHCREAGPHQAGGATLFADTPRIYQDAAQEQRQLWESLEITYSTEKVVHYGGSFSSPLVTPHPISGEKVLRYAEPVTDLNPVTLSVQGLESHQSARFIEDMRERLYHPNYCLRHSWTPGEVVIADNHALLHGRAAYQEATARHLRRINVL